ncbi:hypothetical protein Q99_02741 [Enterococcus faecalis EnGen0064]|nr:hypothetical protein Q99_02741 [Enterococcus faecalis EnGen0064]
MGKLIGKLYETKDYSKFKFLKGNRAIVKSRLLCKMLYNVFTISTYQN